MNKITKIYKIFKISNEDASYIFYNGKLESLESATRFIETAVRHKNIVKGVTRIIEGKYNLVLLAIAETAAEARLLKKKFINENENSVNLKGRFLSRDSQENSVKQHRTYYIKNKEKYSKMYQAKKKEKSILKISSP